MPGNVARANPVDVLPKMLFLSFNESRVYPMLTQTYKDANTERALIVDGINTPRSITTFKLSTRLTGPRLIALRTFYESHLGGRAFFFYHPFFAAPGTSVGSNWDSSGNTIDGRFVVRFTNQTWSEVTDVSMSNVSFELFESA